MAQQNTKSAASKPSVIDVVKVLVRLGPKQINDEIALATAQMKAKGMAAAIAAALVVVGLVFLTFLTVALIVAAIAGLHAAGFQLWAAALIVAGGFLLIALVFALIGLAKFKRTQPLTPEDAIRGLRLDLGVAREGTDFDPKSLDRADEERRRAKAEAKRRSAEQKKTPGEGAPQKPSYTELLRRTALRRDHIAGLQDQLRTRFTRSNTVLDQPPQPQDSLPPEAPAPAPPVDGQDPADARGAKEFFAERWKPLAVAAGSAAAAGAFLRELTKK
ncbi:phage holin family protein [Nesterenkonia salmonea]|uniref:phage holin family protein n=1 Tax=Nesterenkonia salmonea TaxID=1804987 RepID=UPI0014080AF6|nr:phage holin family protein [Nesterenkonia salmonea]